MQPPRGALVWQACMIGHWQVSKQVADGADEDDWWSAIEDNKKFTVKTKDDGRQFVALA